MKVKQNLFFIIVSIVIVVYGGTSSDAAPTLSFPQGLIVRSGDEIVVPVELYNMEDKDSISLFMVRIIYDENVLSNPTAIKSGTLLEGYPIMAKPIDEPNILFNYSVGSTGANINQNGVFIKIRFDVASNFTEGISALSFACYEIGEYCNSVETFFWNENFEDIFFKYIDGWIQAADITPPSVNISSLSPQIVDTAEIEVFISFSEPVEGFDLSDIDFVNAVGRELSFLGNNTYRLLVTPIEKGEFMITLDADVVVDAAGNGNLEAPPFLRIYEAPADLRGDFDQNGIVDDQDAGLFVDHWLSNFESPNWDAKYDLLEDNQIDVFDLSIFADLLENENP